MIIELKVQNILVFNGLYCQIAFILRINVLDYFYESLLAEYYY